MRPAPEPDVRPESRPTVNEPRERPIQVAQVAGFTTADGWLLLLVLIWGLNFAAIQGALREIDVLALGATRFILASVVLLSLVKLRGESLAVPREHWPAVIFLGLVGHTAYQLLFTHGLKETTSGHGSLILALVPVFVALASSVAGLERPGAKRWFGILLSFSGIGLVVLGQPETAADAAAGAPVATVRGDLLVLGGAMAWAAYTAFGRPLMEFYSPLKLTAVTMVVGAAGLTAVGLPNALQQDWAAVSVRAWFLFAYATLGGLVIAYTIWYSGVKRLGGVRTSAYANLVPVVALAFGWAALGERLSALQLVGAVAVLAGVWLARQRRARTPVST